MPHFEKAPPILSKLSSQTSQNLLDSLAQYAISYHPLRKFGKYYKFPRCWCLLKCMDRLAYLRDNQNPLFHL